MRLGEAPGSWVKSKRRHPAKQSWTFLRSKKADKIAKRKREKPASQLPSTSCRRSSAS